jgi:NitT/TauT family transport system ATP-binding protein/nitrate/nitrite transport system substrate-binding protein
MTRLRLGFIALNDAAALIVADAKGWFAEEGLEVELVREVSWATIRDKVDVGALDGAHMLAPMALASAAGGELKPLVAPLALNLNGPAVTLSSRLGGVVDDGGTAAGLARLVARRREEGASPITLAVVFPQSTHNYLLRDWLSRGGIDPDRDVRLTVAPPARMTELLTSGVIEGYCVTEPWGAAAVAAQAGVTAVRASQVWPRTPDKVLAIKEAWAAVHSQTLQALIRVLVRAAAWADANRGELAKILAEPRYVGAPADTIERSLADMIFHVDAANAPETAHAAWLLAQMQRWGHLPDSADPVRIAARVYRADLYASAMAARDPV